MIEPVGGGAAGFGGDEAGAGDARDSPSCRGDLQRLDGAVHRGIGEAAAGSETLAEAHDAGEGVDHAKTMLGRAGDQQAAIIGAESSAA